MVEGSAGEGPDHQSGLEGQEGHFNCLGALRAENHLSQSFPGQDKREEVQTGRNQSPAQVYQGQEQIRDPLLGVHSSGGTITESQQFIWALLSAGH